MAKFTEMKYELDDKSDSQGNLLREPAAVYSSYRDMSVFDVISRARRGVTMHFIHSLAQRMGLSLQEIADILHVSLRTLQRYAPEKVLDTDASSKALKLDALHAHGMLVFGESPAFQEWLKSPLSVLNGQRPLEMLDTPYGFELVDQLLGRIEHGVFA